MVIIARHRAGRTPTELSPPSSASAAVRMSSPVIVVSPPLASDLSTCSSPHFLISLLVLGVSSSSTGVTLVASCFVILASSLVGTGYRSLTLALKMALQACTTPS